MNGTFRDISKTHPVHSNIENTAFATIARSDATYRLFPSKQFVGFLMELCGKIVATANGDLKAAHLVFLITKEDYNC